jgi:hypothetical protein
LGADLGVTGSAPDLLTNMQKDLGGKVPEYALLNEKGFPIALSLSDFEKSGYTMALLGAWKPGSTSDDPSHWLFTYQSSGKWYVDESWRNSGALLQRWAQQDWTDISRVYRPLKLSSK